MKKILFVSFLSLFALLFSSNATMAFDIKNDNIINLAQEEIADGNIYAKCMDMNIDGVVNGDIVAICKNIIINGVVNGDIISFGDSVEINGEIRGSARVVASKININGKIYHNVNAVGEDINLNKDSFVYWDALIAGAMVNIDGNIDGNLQGFLSAIKISGKINKNVELNVQNNNSENISNISVTKEAVIGGNFEYTDKKEARIESSSSISGQIKKNETIIKKESTILGLLWSIFYKVSALFLISLFIIAWKKELILKSEKILDKSAVSNILIGLVIFITTPIIIILSLMTLIGIPLALILSMFYILTIIISPIFGAYVVGKKIIMKLGKKKEINIYYSLLLGLLTLIILTQTPFIGFLVIITTLAYGFSAIFLLLKNKLND